MANSDKLDPKREKTREFKPFPLGLIKPSFDSDLTTLIIDLDHLRKRVPTGTTPGQIFFQIKRK